MIRLSPSLLSADFFRLESEIDEITSGGADFLHLDIMDNHFVPNLTFGPIIARAIARSSKIALDTHLMVSNAEPLIDELLEIPVARIAVHIEGCTHLNRSLAKIRSHGVAAGVAINPSTSLSVLDEALAWVDFVLIMSVNPGFGGQSFISESINKVARLKTMIGQRTIDISVDGGVSEANIGALAAAGAQTLIAGSSVFGASDRRLAITTLRKTAQRCVQRT